MGADSYDAIAMPLEGAERDTKFAEQASQSPIFEEYQAKTGGRRIPVVALSRQ